METRILFRGNAAGKNGGSSSTARPDADSEELLNILHFHDFMKTCRIAIAIQDRGGTAYDPADMPAAPIPA